MKSLQKIVIKKNHCQFCFCIFRPRTKDDLRAYFVLVQVMALFLHACVFSFCL